MSLYDEVYGLSYRSAEEQMLIANESIQQRAGVGFESLKELKQWAHDMHLDKVLFSNMSHKFMSVSHRGEIMLPSEFKIYYGDILFYHEVVGKQVQTVPWVPDGYDYYSKAYIASEQSDGVHRPLYYRDYTVPSGYFNEERDAFNVAKPFPVFAKNTGRDTSHIYTYIEHVAGECAMWLLAWLRAKLLHPTVKTQIVPIIVSRAQGSGKTTFAEVICKGLFGKDNVLVTDQYDSQARFNADYADALIVCQEEKEETDKRNPAGALKSRATATTIRKEKKGIDPIYQESYTDFIMTTNKDVPIKFDGREDQRRFMIMEADDSFTRKTSALADEVFTKLYGFDANYNQCGVPFTEDKDLVAQFKHELFTRQDIADVPLRSFPKTAAYKRCFTLPRTTEATEIESIVRALVPFILESLRQKKLILEAGGQELSSVIQFTGAMQYVPAYQEHIAFVAVCRPLVFYEMGTMKPFQHSVVERGILDCRPWLMSEYGIDVMPDMDPLLGGFTKVAGRYRTAPAAKFCLVSDVSGRRFDSIPAQVVLTADDLPRQRERIGERLRVNKYFKPDKNGCFETVNEMKPGTVSLSDKSQNVQYMDTFLLESDEASGIIIEQEKRHAAEYADMHGQGAEIEAEFIYKERLGAALKESMALFNKGLVARIVYSGAKSYHLLVRVADAPKTLDEYRWLHAWLCQNLTDKLIFDESTSDPARLTRSPLELERTSSMYGLLISGTQRLVAEDWGHIYSVGWRPLYEQWLSKPLSRIEAVHGRPLYPTRKEYREAAEAISDGSFWDDSRFDGLRQGLFFPGYRLLRALGFSHAEVWSLVNRHIGRYKKQNEAGYWVSREQSAIIRQIDADIDERLGSANGGEE